MTTDAVARFLDQFTKWAAAQPDIQAAALVGSHARGSATPTSDLDLVILADDPERFLADWAWVATFGTPVAEGREDYGNLTSLRVHYRDGLEVEFGFTTVRWAHVPVDPGTLDVISGGMQILFERAPILTPLLQHSEVRPWDSDRQARERVQDMVGYPARERWRQLPRDAERDIYFRVLREAVAEFYLADPHNPYQQSGRSSGADRWEQTRRPFVQAIHRSGDFMDIGCANGLLLESLILWAGREGFALRPTDSTSFQNSSSFPASGFPKIATTFSSPARSTGRRRGSTTSCGRTWSTCPNPTGFRSSSASTPQWLRVPG
jgi:hypothetical protein